MDAGSLPGESASSSTGEAASGVAASKPPPLPAPSVPPPSAAAPAELLWRKWLFTAAASLTGTVVLVGGWVAISSRGPDTAPPDQEVRNATVDPRSDGGPDREVTARSAKLDARWLPTETVLLVRCRPSEWADTPVAAKAIVEGRGVWQPTVGRLVRGLGLKLDAVRQLTWAAADLSAWPERCVALVELEPDQDATLLADGGEAAGIALDGMECRKLRSPDWPHPFAVVGPQLIVTGDAALLGSLADRTEPGFASPAIERLLRVVSPEADATLMVDLAAAREAGWNRPAALFDVWPEGKRSWRLLWDVPVGLGCALTHGERPTGRIVLACEGPTAVEEVKAAVDALLPAARTALDARLASLPKRLQAGEITAAAAASYELLLADGLAAARAARSEVIDEIVVVHVPGAEKPAALATAALDRRNTIHDDWLAAARSVDEGNHRRLIAGLGGYAKAEGRYPPGVAGGALLAPETRLSWIATMLPYLDHSEWHRQLEFGYMWNGPQNREIAGQELPEVVNPAVGPEQDEAGFPVTHYVGVAGVGPGAARLPPDDPRAGVFGFRRSAKPEEIADGASNTIAVAGVTGGPGPWAAGGHATVRAFTQRPYVNGPDGFGSGQPDGMLVTMADGSVRFLSKDVAPEVVEQLATVSGGGDTTVAALGGRPEIPPPMDDPEPAVEPEIRQPAVPEAPQTPAGPAPPAVDVGPRLAMKIPEIELPPMELGQAVLMLSSISGVPITFDPEAMAQLDVSLRDQVELKMSGASVAEILRALAAQHRLVPVVADGQVLLTTSAEHRQRLYPLKYTVSDLTGGDPQKLVELAATVRRLVAPETWRPAGGRGTLETRDDALRVTQTAPVHHELLVFCEKLRVARGRPTRSRRDPAQFRLETRRQQAQAVLARPVTANFHQPTPLLEIAGHLARTAAVDVLIDRIALHAEGLSGQTRATLVAHDEPLEGALKRLGQSAGVAWRVIDAGTLQITSPAALVARPDLEFYPVGDLLGRGRSGAGLVETLTTQVGPGTWSEAGGPGAVEFDEPSGCLIVRQPQPVQAEVERLLAEWAGP